MVISGCEFGILFKVEEVSSLLHYTIPNPSLEFFSSTNQCRPYLPFQRKPKYKEENNHLRKKEATATLNFAASFSQKGHNLRIKANGDFSTLVPSSSSVASIQFKLIINKFITNNTNNAIEEIASRLYHGLKKKNNNFFD